MQSDLKCQFEQFRTLYSIALDLLHNHEMDDVLEKIGQRASELLDCPAGFLGFVDGDFIVTKTTTELVKSEIGARVPVGEAKLSALAIETRQPQFVTNYIGKPARVKKWDPYQMRAACTFPIFIGDQVAGILGLGRTRANFPFTADDVEAMSCFAQLAGLAMQNASLFAEIKRDSLTDALTGLANRRHFDFALDQEWKHALRDKRCLALIMGDIDCFKKYNDTYDHTQGDDCLRQVARVFAKAGRRAYDLPCRFGGEEFALILPSTNLLDAKRVAMNLRRNVKALKIPHQSSKTTRFVTVSLGVASLIPLSGMEPSALIALADKALFRAKQSGRNRVCAL